jgi:hypothetical protein
MGRNIVMLADCPDCGLPATVESRGTIPSTTGEIDLVYLRCVNRHWFLAPRDRLIQAPTPAQRFSPTLLLSFGA